MPVNIKGKEYKTVAERILELNSNTNGNYSIHTRTPILTGITVSTRKS